MWLYSAKSTKCLLAGVDAAEPIRADALDDTLLCHRLIENRMAYGIKGEER